MDVRVVLLVMEGGAPAEIDRRNFHRLGQLCLVRQQKFSPTLTIFVAQPVGVLPLQRIDEGPHRSGVVTDLIHGALQISGSVSRKQAVGPRTLCHVFQIAATLMGEGWSNQQLHTLPGGDVLGVVTAAGTWLNIAGLLDQSWHYSAPL